MNKKFFNLDKNNNLIPAKKKYINKNNYEIENIKTDNNFEVDLLIAETISILNKKGYITTKSYAGYPLSYSLVLGHCPNEDIKIDENGNKYYIIANHGYIPFKYVFIDEYEQEYKDFLNSDEKILEQFKILNEDKNCYTGVCQVISPTTKCMINFKNPINVKYKPNEFVLENTSCYKSIARIKQLEPLEWLSYENIQKEIIESNKILLDWAKFLPDFITKK